MADSKPSSPASLLPALVAAAALTAQLVGAKVTRDALFLSHHGAAELSRAMVLSSSVGAVSVVVLSRALQLLGPARVVAGLALLSTALFGLEGALSAGSPRLAGEVLYVHVAALGAPAIAAFWSLLGERFDPHAARHVFSRVGAACGLGGLLGSVVVWFVGTSAPVSVSLAVLVAVGLVALGSTVRFTSTAVSERREGDPARSSPGSTTTGLAELVAAPYLRDLALVVLVASLTAAMADYLLATSATASVGRGPGLVRFFALFQLSIALASFLAQTLLAERATAWLGLVRTAATLPLSLVVLGGAALALPGVTILALLRASHSVLQNSLFRSAYELLFTPVPPTRKRATKLFIDVACDRLGGIVGSVIAGLVVTFAPGATRPVLLVLIVVVSLASLALGRRLHRGYLASLAERLQSGVIRLDAGHVRDEATLRTLTLSAGATGAGADEATGSRTAAATAGITSTEDPGLALVAALRSDDLTRRREAFALAQEPWLVSLIAPSLVAPGLVPEATAALRRLGPRAVGQLTDLLLDPETPLEVRRRLPFVLKACRSTRSVDGLVAALTTRDEETRDHVAVALATLADAGVAIPAAPLVEAVLDELHTTTKDDHGPRETTLFTLLSLAYDREGVELAARALRGNDEALRGTAIEYLDRLLPERVRRPLLAHLGDPSPRAPGRGALDALAELRRSSIRLPSR